MHLFPTGKIHHSNVINNRKQHENLLYSVTVYALWKGNTVSCYFKDQINCWSHFRHIVCDYMVLFNVIS